MEVGRFLRMKVHGRRRGPLDPIGLSSSKNQVDLELIQLQERHGATHGATHGAMGRDSLVFAGDARASWLWKPSRRGPQREQMGQDTAL